MERDDLSDTDQMLQMEQIHMHTKRSIRGIPFKSEKRIRPKKQIPKNCYFLLQNLWIWGSN